MWEIAHQYRTPALEYHKCDRQTSVVLGLGKLGICLLEQATHARAHNYTLLDAISRVSHIFAHVTLPTPHKVVLFITLTLTEKEAGTQRG